MLKKRTTHLRFRRHQKKRILLLLFTFVMGIGSLASAGICTYMVYAEDTNRQYSLESAAYQLYTDEACTSEAKDINGNNAVLTTNASGEAGILEMASGTYYAKEIAAGKGYMLDSNVHTINVTESNTASSPVSFTSAEPPSFGTPDFRVYKTAKGENYTDYNKFLGVEFTIKYYDVESKEEITGSSPKDQWTFVTEKKDPPGFDNDPSHFYAGFDWQTDEPVASSRSDKSFYTDANGRRILPVGWFTIEETKAPAGYKKTAEIYYGHIYQDPTGGTAITVMEGPDVHEGSVRELVFRNEPCCTYIKKTDATTGKEITGAKMQLLKGTMIIDEWVSAAEEHRFEALEAGAYTLREISAPYGYDIADDVSFTVVDGQDSRIVMKNIPVTVGTSAVDADSERRVGCTKPSAVITDSVHMTGLQKDRMYMVTGKLINKATGKAIKGKSGEVIASETFKATAEVMDVKMEFPVDSSKLEPGTELVVYETLFRTSAVHEEKVPVELQKHENINDKNQTVIYPGISTIAIDKSTGTHNLLAGENAVIKDTITYTGLLTGEKYTIKGELYDKTEGRLTGIKSTAEIQPDTENGKTTMEFRFDASSLSGHTLVVYETLINGSTVLTEHRDSNDTGQTIYIPKIKTTAGISEDMREIRDVVYYENLLPDTSYVLRGWLVDTVTGEKVPESDGSVTFESGKKSTGQIEMILMTEKYEGMQGHSVTAFEEMYMTVKEDGEEKEIPVAYHKDIKDTAQIVEIYQNLKIQKKVTGNLGDHTKVFQYRAVFENLVPDHSYTVEGDDRKVFNADQAGKATIPFSLRDGQGVTIKQLPKGTKYRVEEISSDYAASFRVFSENMSDKGAIITQFEGSNGEETVDALATAVETVDLFDGTVVVLWENDRNMATLTAVPSNIGIRAVAFALAGTVLMVLIVLVKAGKRRGYAEEDETLL